MVTVPLMVTKLYPSSTQIAIRGSRFMLRSLIRPSLVFIKIVSPSRRYHIVVSWGEPSLLRVASTAKRCSCRNARAFSDSVVGIHVFPFHSHYELCLGCFPMQCGNHSFSVGTDKFSLVPSHVMDMDRSEERRVGKECRS